MKRKKSPLPPAATPIKIDLLTALGGEAGLDQLVGEIISDEKLLMAPGPRGAQVRRLAVAYIKKHAQRGARP